jgi:hypothetical protein
MPVTTAAGRSPIAAASDDFNCGSPRNRKRGATRILLAHSVGNVKSAGLQAVVAEVFKWPARYESLQADQKGRRTLLGK